MRQEQTDPAAMAAAVRLAPLDALALAARSAPNRATLLAAGTLPALAAILDAAISRLNALAAVLGQQADRFRFQLMMLLMMLLMLADIQDTALGLLDASAPVQGTGRAWSCTIGDATALAAIAKAVWCRLNADVRRRCMKPCFPSLYSTTGRQQMFVPPACTAI